ncbi:MAG TPA: protein kinase, partial [Bryobacterales bacterium]|nr:protein kinase [Bryobacterales bacterium]
MHRDLKPENLFLTKDGRIKILDFGLAKLTQPEPAAGTGSNAPTVADVTEPGRILGTAGYMSPEQVRGRPTDHRSDLFTLGAILYEMLGGRRAFRGESAVEVMNAILREDPPDLSETSRSVSPALDRIVRHCLEKNPEQRFQSARDVAFNLEALSGTSTPSGSAAALAPVPLRNTRRRAVALAAALVLLAAAFVAGRRLGFVAAERGHVPPSFKQLTFRRGIVSTARFAPDGQTIVYSAAWDGQPTELFSARLEFPESRSLGLSEVRIAAISPSGEMALVLSSSMGAFGNPGILARAPLAGGSPRKILEGISDADWSPDGGQLAVVRSARDKVRLEFPVGKVLYETSGNISFPRVSARGDRVAFFDHPLRNDDRGAVAVVDLAGRKTTLSSGWASVQGLAWSRQNPGEIWFTASAAGIGRNLYGVTLGGQQRAILRVPGGIVLQDVSRDGRVLMVREESRFSIAGLAPGETKERDLTWFGRSIAIDLSQDGKTLLFREEGDPVGPNYAVCIRKTDGSPPIRLGEGMPLALSPDGAWVLAAHPTQPGIFLLPTGAGDARKLKTDPVETADQGSWFPDSRRIAFHGSEPGKPGRCFTFDIDGSGPPRPVTPEGTLGCAVSPDGKWIGAGTFGPTLAVAAYPIAGGEPQRLPGLLPGEFP